MYLTRNYGEGGAGSVIYVLLHDILHSDVCTRSLGEIVRPDISLQSPSLRENMEAINDVRSVCRMDTALSF